VSREFAWVYSSSQYRTAKRNLFNDRARRPLCWFCGKWVDYSLPVRHPMAKSVHHVVDLQDGGDPFDPENMELAHITCNSSAGASRQAEVKKERRVRTHTRPSPGIWVHAPKGSV
jgi:5-methylcytosine-specific restriction endonuclease McrA